MEATPSSVHSSSLQHPTVPFDKNQCERKLESLKSLCTGSIGDPDYDAAVGSLKEFLDPMTGIDMPVSNRMCESRFYSRAH